LPFQLPRGVIEERTHAILGVLQIFPSISDIFLLGTVAVAVCFKVGFAQLVAVFFEVLIQVVLLTFGGVNRKVKRGACRGVRWGHWDSGLPAHWDACLSYS
jgi:hypothetical protein